MNERQVLVNLGEAEKGVNEVRMETKIKKERKKERKKKERKIKKKKKKEEKKSRVSGSSACRQGKICSAAPGRRLAAECGIAPAPCASGLSQGLPSPSPLRLWPAWAPSDPLKGHC